MESKYLMAIIKMPVEIFKDGKTITHEDKCVIDYEPINELPTTLNNNNKLDLSKLFYTDDEASDNDEPDEVKNTIPLLEKKIYIKSEEMLKKKNRSKNSTFKSKKFNTKQPTRKMYPPMVDNDPDVDSVQSLEDLGSLLEDD
jgi:hypothetical protein